MADAAHRLASPSRHLKAEKLYKILKKIENAGRENTNTSELSSLLEKAGSERDNIVDIIRERMTEIEKLI